MSYIVHPSLGSGVGTILGKTNSLCDQLSAAEQREFARHKIALPGKLFLPAEDASFDCHVLNPSCGGAGVKCEEPPPLRSFVVLYIDGFGRIEGLTSRYIDGELGLQFVCGEAKRQHLLNDILYFVIHGTKASTRTRLHTRSASVKWGHFLRPNGDCVRCEALDISLQGISLKTDLRPPIGELAKLGRVFGRVVRHHNEGIAIQFLEATDRPFDVD